MGTPLNINLTFQHVLRVQDNRTWSSDVQWTHSQGGVVAVVLVVVVKVVVIVVATDAVESILLLFGVSGECVPWASIRLFQKGKRRGR